MSARDLARVSNDFEPSRHAVTANTFVTIPQAAKMLGQPLSTIRDRVRKRGLRPIRTPGSIRYLKVADLPRLLGQGNLKAVRGAS